jgi:NAD(P)-dependent dehydrogenase (short-subunit alcohol dehydrogenase family)
VLRSAQLSRGRSTNFRKQSSEVIMDNGLDRKVAIVTGAAGGIGRAVAELLHARGAQIVAEDVNPEVEQLARPGMAPLVADIAEDGSAERAVARALQEFGRLDILVNNAARIINKPVVEMTRHDWQSIMAVNVTGAFLHSREAMKAMIPNKSGAIVNVASYAAYFAFPGIAAYTASKGALVQLTRTLALEAIEHGIRVNAVGSGDVVTNIWAGKMEDGQSFLAGPCHQSAHRPACSSRGDRASNRVPGLRPGQLLGRIGRDGGWRHER